MSRQKKRINRRPITTNELYTLSLFTLWKLQDIPEYASTSELMYILDKDSLLKLIEYYGGKTITIPTQDDLRVVMYTLLLYQYINVDKFSYTEATKKIRKTAGTDIGKKVEDNYTKLVRILNDYQIDLWNS